MRAGSDEDDYVQNQKYLEHNLQFQQMPAHTQHLIFASPHASSDFSNFFRAKGTIVKDPAEPLAQYFDVSPPRISVNEGTYLDLQRPDGARYPDMEQRMFSMLAHEIGHHKYNLTTQPFSENGTVEDYVAYRSTIEAHAVFNAFPIFADLAKSQPDFRPSYQLGYAHSLELAGCYKRWQAGTIGAEDVIANIAAGVPNFPYSRQDGLQDLGGQPGLTWRDAYMRDYTRIFRPSHGRNQSNEDGPTSHPAENKDNPKHPEHRDHTLYQQVRSHVHRLDTEAERTPDDTSKRLTASLMCLAKENGLSHVDHVVLSEHKREGRVIRGENIFVVQRALNDVRHYRGCMKTADATNKPEIESYRQLDSLNRQFDQQEALNQRQQSIEQHHDVHHHGLRR